MGVSSSFKMRPTCEEIWPHLHEYTVSESTDDPENRFALFQHDSHCSCASGKKLHAMSQSTEDRETRILHNTMDPRRQQHYIIRNV